VRRAAVALLLVAGLAGPASGSTGSDRLTVFAASSLTNVLPKVDRGPRYSFAGSDQLAFQIRQGAPVDVFAAASPKYPQDLYGDGLVSRPRVFATNRLVVIVPRSNPAGIKSVTDLRKDGVRLVIGAAGVPIGDYTRQVLARLRLSSALDNVVSEETDVRSVVAKVVLGAANAGIVYTTDARTAPRKLRTVTIPKRGQPVVKYEIAVVTSTDHAAAARAYVQRVLGPAGRRALRTAGFGLP
jgi:molybdate transport system substrate-binding protein